MFRKILRSIDLSCGQYRWYRKWRGGCWVRVANGLCMIFWCRKTSYVPSCQSWIVEEERFKPDQPEAALDVARAVCKCRESRS